MADNQTPEEENKFNMGEENIKQMLDKVIHKHQQSYESFVDSFTYLTAEDVNKMANKKLPENKIKFINKLQSTEETNHSSRVTNGNQLSNNKPAIEEDLEEEILDTMVVNKTSDVIPTSLEKKQFTKFDNFISNENNDDGDNDDDDDIGKGYQASFCTNTDCSQTSQMPAKNELEQNKLPSSDITTFKIKPDDTFQPEIKCSPYQADEDGFLLNPGEAEREITPTDLNSVPQTRCLDFSCKMAEVSNIKNSEQITSCTDEVEPFCLDDQFDYDNVILTPKYNSQEMDYLLQFKIHSNDNS